jgi:fructokinase
MGMQGCNLDALPILHEGRSILANYLGQCAAVIALTLSVERIVFGGGVTLDGTLLPLIRAATARHLNGYLEPLRDSRRLADYICAPALGDRAGICGALLLARMTGDSHEKNP